MIRIKYAGQKVYPGSIIVILQGLCAGNRAKTITKVVRTNNKIGGSPLDDDTIIVKNTSKRIFYDGLFYEYIHDVRLATKVEKEMYQRGIYTLKD